MQARKKLLIATTNKGKVREIERLLERLPVEILHLDSDALPQMPEAPEDQDTFEGNAVQKAKHYGDLSGLATVAEDAGLTIPSLDGWPGVLSSRVAENDEDRVKLALSKLEGTAGDEREAAFVSVAAFYEPGTGITMTFPGFCQGYIADKPKGHNGFGYDPVFYHPGYGKTLAELTTEEKNEVSHRGQSFRLLVNFLKGYFSE